MQQQLQWFALIALALSLVAALVGLNEKGKGEETVAVFSGDFLGVFSLASGPLSLGSSPLSWRS